jgi:hypothetical protein
MRVTPEISGHQFCLPGVENKMAYERLSNNLKNASARCEELIRNLEHIRSEHRDELSSDDLSRFGRYHQEEFREAWNYFSLTQLLLNVGTRLCDTTRIA